MEKEMPFSCGSSLFTLLFVEGLYDVSINSLECRLLFNFMRFREIGVIQKAKSIKELEEKMNVCKFIGIVNHLIENSLGGEFGFFSSFRDGDKAINYIVRSCHARLMIRCNKKISVSMGNKILFDISGEELLSLDVEEEANELVKKIEYELKTRVPSRGEIEFVEDFCRYIS